MRWACNFFNYLISLLKIGITSGKLPNEKDKFIRSDIDLERYFLKSLTTSVGMLLEQIDVCIFLLYLVGLLHISVIGDKQRAFL